jgi:hypothetical protein
VRAVKVGPLRDACYDGVPRVKVPIWRSDHWMHDERSLLMHRQAVLLFEADPALAERALQTLARWLATGSKRSESLWREWERIIVTRNWSAALDEGERGDELRQASPLTTILPPETRDRYFSRRSTA